MLGSWMGLFLGIIVILSLIFVLNSKAGILKVVFYLNPIWWFEKITDTYGAGSGMLSIFTLPIALFLWGWIIHSLVRRLT